MKPRSAVVLVLVLLSLALLRLSDIRATQAQGPMFIKRSSVNSQPSTSAPLTKPDPVSPRPLLHLVAAPPNDAVSSASVITGVPFADAIDTTGATVGADDPSMLCGASQNSNTVWYRLSLSATTTLAIDTLGSDYDTVLAVFAGRPGNLQWVACNDDAMGTQSRLSFVAEGNHDYYIEVADYGSPGGGTLYLAINPIADETRNAFLSVIQSLDISPGRFVVGTTGGEPGSDQDNNKRLLYGYPSTIGSSFTTFRVITPVGPRDYRLSADNALPTGGPSVENGVLTTRWSLDGFAVTQRLSLAPSPETGRPDTARIEYQVTNTTAVSQQVGMRIMLDTMIGDNDGAPIFVPGYGRITSEREFASGTVPDYWIAWESGDFAPSSLKARAHLRGGDATEPSRLVIAHWDDDLCAGAGSGLFSSDWDYTPNPNATITCDSAVAMYYNPAPLGSGQSRTLRTYYGLAGTLEALGLAPDVIDFIRSTSADIDTITSSSQDVAAAGDYFLAKMGRDRAKLLTKTLLNTLDLATLGVSWSRVGHGLNRIVTDRGAAALHASWRGWTGSAARHWSKPLYDSLHYDRQGVFIQTARSGFTYFAKSESISRISDWFADILSDATPNVLTDQLGRQASELGESYNENLHREQDEVLALLPTLNLTPQQIQQYRADLMARQEADEQLRRQAESHRDLIWQTYQRARADEDNWWNDWGFTLTKVAIVVGATAAFDGPGFYVSSVGLASVSLLYDGVKYARDLAQDELMYDQSLRFLGGRSSLAYMEISLNAVRGLNMIRDRQPAQTAEGTVEEQAQKSFGHYRLWPSLWWAEESAQMEVSITNTQSFETTYLTSASYDHSDWWSGSQRFLPEGQALDLAGGARSVAVIPLKSKDWGETPGNNGAIDVLVFGASDTGVYPIAEQRLTWNPTRVEQATGQQAAPPTGVTAKQVDEAPRYPFPLTASLTTVPDSTDYRLTLHVVNPFTLTVTATLSQPLPGGAQTSEAEGANLENGSIVWRATLEPGQHRTYLARLTWPLPLGASPTLPQASLAFREPASSGGDTYQGPALAAPLAWPLSTRADMPPEWRIDAPLTLPLMVTNLSATSAVSALMTATVSTPEGTLLTTAAVSVELPAGETRSLSMPVIVPRHLGTVVVRGSARVGSVEQPAFYEIAIIRGYEVVLPHLARNAYLR